MSDLTLNIKYDINGETVMSPSELINMYFFGVSIINSSGETITDQDLLFAIQAAQKEIEKELDIKILKQVIQERKSFYKEELAEWGYMPTTYPVNAPVSLDAYYAEVKQVTYPKEWLSYKKSNDGDSFHRKLFLVPPGILTGGAANNPVFLGIMPQLSFQSQNNVPYFWEMTYVTGFDRVPEDLINAIGKLASINVFNQLGDIVLGAGIASQSLSVDGLSQSIVTTSSAENSAYSARIRMYLNDLKALMPKLKDYYRGILFTSC